MSEARIATIGHNRPPTLEDELIAETAKLAERSYELIICADERAEVVDDDTAARAVQLAAMMRTCYDDLEKARVDRKEPFLVNGRTVDRHFHGIIEPLAGPEPKKRIQGAIGDLLSRIDQYRRQREAEAAVKGLAEAVSTAARRPLDSGVGPKTGTRTERRVEIDDYAVALKHCLVIDAHRIYEVIHDIYRGQLRTGVQTLPGARIIEDTKTVLRRK